MRRHALRDDAIGTDEGPVPAGGGGSVVEASSLPLRAGVPLA